MGAGGWQPEGWYRHNGKTCKPVATSWGVLLGIAEVLLGTAAETLLYCYRQTPIDFQRGQLGLSLCCYFFAATSFLERLPLKSTPDPGKPLIIW
ncbi:hypothetical protein [Achromobacter spanius]|uniref:hypothetical protein n=1 Tax=Achromobacter spanius TaxID=217203 RepID=UPI0011B01474|nr:hypothetical protein [Achromobacter spanius]